MKLTLEEMTPEHQQPSWKPSGPWKLYLLLLIIILTLMCHGHCNTTGHHPHTSAASNMTIMTRPAAITADISIAVGGSISRQCLEALLLIGGVEQNPGPTQDDILAAVCADAPTTEVRDCLRRYKPENSLQQHRTDFNQCAKNVLVATFYYLKKPDQDLYNKTACVINLICRIQNLLPDECSMCGQEYCVALGDTPLLSCAICGQGSHNDCIWKYLDIPTSLQDTFGPEDALSKLNPTTLPGVHYLCGACEISTIPDPEDGCLKKKGSSATDEVQLPHSQSQQSAAHDASLLNEETQADKH